MKPERKGNPYFGVEISRSNYKGRYDSDRDIELSISTNGYHWIGLPTNMNIQDLKELRKSIRKYIKENKQ